MADKPTHLAVLKSGFITKVYVQQELRDQLDSEDNDLRKNANIHLRKLIRGALSVDHPGFKDKRTLIGEFQLFPIAPETWLPTTVRQLTQPHCCDDDNCPVCDMNNHHWCRKGCTLGRRR